MHNKCSTLYLFISSLHRYHFNGITCFQTCCENFEISSTSWFVFHHKLNSFIINRTQFVPPPVTMSSRVMSPKDINLNNARNIVAQMPIYWYDEVDSTMDKVSLYPHIKQYNISFLISLDKRVLKSYTSKTYGYFFGGCSASDQGKGYTRQNLDAWFK